MSARGERNPDGRRAGLRRATAGDFTRGLRHGLAALWLMGGAALLLLVMTVFGDHGIFRIRQLGRDRVALGEKVAALERETALLRRRLDDHRDGRVSLERVARERLGLVRPGEVVYDFRPDPLQ